MENYYGQCSSSDCTCFKQNNQSGIAPYLHQFGGNTSQDSCMQQTCKPQHPTFASYELRLHSYKTEGFDEGHLHHASPIHGLPPEDKPHSYTTGHVKSAVQWNHWSEEQATATHAFGVGRMAKGHKLDPNMPHTVNLPSGDFSKDNWSPTLEPIKHCRLAPLQNSGYQASPTLTPMQVVTPETIDQTPAG